MQLIVNTDIDTNLPIKMSTIEQKSLDQKFDHAVLLENLINDYEGVKESIKCDQETEESCKYNQNDSSNSEIVDDKEVLSEGEDVKNVSNGNDEKSEQDKGTSTDNECPITENLEEANDLETIESVAVSEKQVDNDKHVCETINIKQMHTEDSDKKNETELTNPVQHVNECDLSECDNDVSEINANDKSNNETSSINAETEEVINITDEKDEESVNNMLDEMDSAKAQNNNNTDDNKINEQDVIVSNTEKSPEQNTKLDVIFSENISNPLEKENQISVVPEKRLSTENCTEEKKKLTHICKLSNTLDILSDEEEELPNLEEVKESQNEPIGNKQCINIEDDDDIMLIDEETSKNNCKESETSDKISDFKGENTTTICKEDITKDKDIEKDDVAVASNQKETEDNMDDGMKTEIKDSEPKPEMKPDTVLNKPRPLLKPTKFLKICKKNLADLTREELEEFCIMKIVEGVVDRSNLSEIKTQLKTMAQNFDEYKKKALMITKQNRDLQVVLKSVQEEQKKHSDTTVTPLKITRSVGMQVLMTDKSGVKRKPVLGHNNLYSNTKQNKPSPPNSKKNQLIPVPRLVPAVINNNVNNKTPPGKQGCSVLHNGIPSKSSPPIQKPEKRTHTKMQQDVTVDLTDDEPPSKQLQRNMNPPVRLVNPQNLMATPRQPFSSTVNSPRKVYIPISGSQTQGVRPGQTFMLKAISPQQGPRPRMGPALMSKQAQNARITRPLTRHPAPLPESSKQFEPPNWKSLPPAPELKLSKVENGIVISWKIDGYIEDNYEEIASFQLYAYQETSSPPSTALWKKIGDVKALPLPMACTLTQFMAGYKYYFAVRAVDVKSRVGHFSEPGSILLLNKM